MSLTDLIKLTILHTTELDYRAWTNAEAMQVYADQLIEEGRIEGVDGFEAERMSRAYRDIASRDLALYWIECRAREHILGRSHPKLELRITGGWPDLLFLVTYPTRGDHVRVPFQGAPKDGTPRLLR